MDYSRVRQSGSRRLPMADQEVCRQGAEFFFVPAEKVTEEANRLDATPYDVKNVELGPSRQGMLIRGNPEKVQPNG